MPTTVLPNTPAPAYDANPWEATAAPTSVQHDSSETVTYARLAAAVEAPRSARQAPPPPPPRRAAASVATPAVTFAPAASVSGSTAGRKLTKKAGSTAGEVTASAGSGAAAPASLALPKLSFKQVMTKKVAQYTTKMGMTKLAGKGIVLGFAGVGVYFVVNAIIHAAQVGVSAKVGAILVPVAAGVAGGAVLMVLGYMAYKGLRNLNQTAKAEAASDKQQMFEAYAAQKASLSQPVAA